MMLFFPVHADTDTEQQIKVSFVYNFAKFVTWSNVANNTTIPLVICVNASQALLIKFSMLKNKKVNSRSIEVRPLNQVNQASNCNLIFLSETENMQNKNLLESIALLPILTISDKADFIQEGGIIGMKELNNRLRFDINLVAAKKAGLILSSQLSSLADEVIQ